MPNLAEVAEINPRFDRSLLSDMNEAVSFVPMANVSESLGAIASEDHREVADVIKGFTAFQDRDVLVAKITPCFENGKIAHARIGKRFGFGSTEFHVVRPRAEKLDDRYLYHFLRQPVVREEGERRMMGSAGQKRVPKAFLEELDIPLPSLPEQRRIAAILDKADALRVKRREAIAKLDQLLQSVFIDMFGDPVTNPRRLPTAKFASAVDFTTGHPFKSAEFLPAAQGIKLCRGTNVLPAELDWSDEANWSPSDAERFDHFKIVAGDVIVAMDRPWISSGFKIVLVAHDDPDCLLVQRVARLRPLSYFGPNFLYALFASDSFKRHCKPTETTIPHISPTDFRSFPILDPGEAAIAAFESVAEKVKLHMRRLSGFGTGAENLFASLQRRAFSGNL